MRGILPLGCADVLRGVISTIAPSVASHRRRSITGAS
jgi:hypothetical protein